LQESLIETTPIQKGENTMRKSLSLAFAGVAGLCAGEVFAQVTMYGIIDTGVEYVTNTNAAGNSVLKMPSLTGSLPSRFGIKGVEDLGGGLQTLYVLEAGFAPDTGTLGQGNRLFGRQSYVGIKNAYGTWMLGRQVNMTYIAGLKADIMGPNIYGNGSIDAYLPNARSDNAIGYLGNFSGFTIGATYSLGRDASATGGPAATNCPGELAGNVKACRQWTALLGYDGKDFGMALAYDLMHGGPGAAAPLGNADYTDRRITANGYAMFGRTKVGIGLENRRTEALATATSNLYFAGFSHPLSLQWILDGQVTRYQVNDTDRRATLAVARLNYKLSKRTTVYGSLGHIRNSASSAVSLDPGGTVGLGMNQTGLMTGVQHVF
jgi:predicted porin